MNFKKAQVITEETVKQKVRIYKCDCDCACELYIYNDFKGNDCACEIMQDCACEISKDC